MKNRKLLQWFCLSGLLIALNFATTSRSGSLAAGETMPLRLKYATFDPLQGEPQIPRELVGQDIAPDEQGVYIVQFNQPLQEAWADQLSARGVQVVDYLPENAYLVRVSGAIGSQLPEIDHVRWVGAYHPAYKLSPDLGMAEWGMVVVTLFPGTDLSSFQARLKDINTPTNQVDGERFLLLLPDRNPEAVALWPEVYFVEPYLMPQADNDIAAADIMGGNIAWGTGLTGSGMTVTVADTGIDSGVDTATAGDMHADFDNRFNHIQSWAVQSDGCGGCCWTNNGADDGAQDNQSGHGTHVLGSLAGNGAASSGQIKGLAYQAALTFQAVEQLTTLAGSCGSGSLYALTGIPQDLNSLFGEAYNWGARIHSNSWGSNAQGAYTTYSADVDEFIWNHPDFTILFSAGNAGTDANADGYVDVGSLGSPATAKNAISAGAADNERATGGYAPYSWNQLWPSDYLANPTRDDLTSDSRQELAAFSSRGPVDDGRIKPDLVAPGTNILSTRSQYISGNGWGAYSNPLYMYNGGTSMSNPLIAGAAALVREYYVEERGAANPSAALIKATLINSAVDIQGYGNNSQEGGQPIPNNHEGWGLVNVGAATTGTRLFRDSDSLAATGDSLAYTYHVSSGSSPLKITLVWSDYPGSPAALGALVNNLNLTVTTPDGVTQFFGNQFSDGWTTPGGTADSLNNVENVYIQNPQVGSWTVQISAATIAHGPQPFALVATGSLATTPVETIDVPLDIIVLQDETGSMADDINALKNLAPQIWDSVAALSTAEFRMGVVGFRDYARYPWGDYADFVYRKLMDPTISRDSFDLGVQGLTAVGGYDEPEAQYASLNYLLTSTHPCIDSNGDGDCLDSMDTATGQQPAFRTGATRVILLATDAPFHDPLDTFGYPGPDRDKVVESLLNNRVILIGLVPGGQGRIPEVDDLATATGGSVQDTGATGDDVAQAILAALQQIRPVSESLSSVEVNPETVLADSEAVATVTVTLRDTAGSPVIGKDVLIMTDRGDLDVVIQPAAPTGPDGVTTGQVLSAFTGTSRIIVVDATDGVFLAQQPTVQFTYPTIPPNEDLARCINLLANQSGGELDLLGDLAIETAADARYFNDVIGYDIARRNFDIFWSFVDAYPAAAAAGRRISTAMGYRFPGFLSDDWFAVRFLKDRYPDAGDFFHLELMESIRSGGFHWYPARAWNDGLLYYGAELLNSAIEDITTEQGTAAWGEVFANTERWNTLPDPFVYKLASLSDAIEDRRQFALGHVPEMSDSMQSAFANDLCLRSIVPGVLGKNLENQADLTHNLRTAHDSIGNGGLGLFLLKFAGSNLSYIMWDGAGKFVFDGITNALDIYLDQQKINAAERAFDTATAFFNGLPQINGPIWSNLYEGYDRLTLRLNPPHPVEGEIASIRNYSEGTDWGIYWQEHASYSDIEVRNTGSERAEYIIYVDYGYNSRLLGLPWVYTPIIKQATLFLDPGETGSARIYYKEEAKGGSPENDWFIRFSILGENDSGVFHVDGWAEPWKPIRVSSSGAGAVAAQPASDTLSIENPIDSYLLYNPENGTYSGEIWVANPFTATITASITQTIPGSATLLETDGTVMEQEIHWEKTIAASDIISLTYTIMQTTAPGKEVTMPAATLAFDDPATDQNLTTQSNIPAIPRAWPLRAKADLPPAVFATDYTLPITITNITNGLVNGGIHLTITDSGGKRVYDNTEAITITGLGTKIINFTVPGSVRPGIYWLEIRAIIDGAEGILKGDLYQVLGYKMFMPNLVKR